MRIRRVVIENFRGVSSGVVDLPGHTLLVGDNNAGKSTVCEALELALGTERLFRRPIVDEHDFHNGEYLHDGKPVVIRIEVILLGLPEETQRKLFSKTRPWSESKGGFVDVQGVKPSDLDGDDIERALPVVFMGWYDRKLDDFDARTYFAHPPTGKLEEEAERPGDGLEAFGREWKQKCGFIYLRTLRTGRRALSLERGRFSIRSCGWATRAESRCGRIPFAACASSHLPSAPSRSSKRSAIRCASACSALSALQIMKTQPPSLPPI
ncbi:AAA family ATPase [Mesorhizobium sp. M4B.F.Ca.ET.143.01.1.1]|uniref:AAA family ATPase n=1 Tax=Mesorhizobium sp. M4B.F.Ca.ET.143.01.1.1 TaxID=2563947 RepID=UPI001FEF33BF|nr:AAA family ATPase [Mesorhizobium sp. M4B.F.Ca.ET.143.01.1.1]